MRLPVSITSLAMRFSCSAGWTEEILRKYLLYGNLILRGFGEGEKDHQYYILDVGSKLDVDKMFEDGIVEVFGKDMWGETKNLSDIDAMKSRNW